MLNESKEHEFLNRAAIEELEASLPTLDVATFVDEHNIAISCDVVLLSISLKRLFRRGYDFDSKLAHDMETELTPIKKRHTSKAKNAKLVEDNAKIQEELTKVKMVAEESVKSKAAKLALEQKVSNLKVDLVISYEEVLSSSVRIYKLMFTVQGGSRSSF
ncbi:hypothetical protein ACFE04_026471 [Oxalis oulophora]